MSRVRKEHKPHHITENNQRTDFEKKAVPSADSIISKLEIAFKSDDDKIKSTQKELNDYVTYAIGHLIVEREKNNSIPANELWKILTYLYQNDFIKLKKDINTIEDKKDPEDKFPLTVSYGGNYKFRNPPYDIYLIRNLIENRFDQQLKEKIVLKPISKLEDEKKTLQNNITALKLTDEFYLLKEKLKDININWGKTPLFNEKESLKPEKYTGHENKNAEEKIKKQKINKALALRYKVILFDLYQEKITNKSFDQTNDLGLRNLLVEEELLKRVGDKFIPNDTKLFRNLISKFQEEFNVPDGIKNILKEINDIYEVKNIMPDNATKLREFEQAIINVYYKVRKEENKSQDRDAYRKLGNIIENFIKSKSGLNLIEKYGINIPHNVQEGDVAKKIKKQVPKNIALVHTDCLSSNKKFDIIFFNKLKFEYDEVVFWGPKPDREIKKRLEYLDYTEKFNILKKEDLENDQDIINLKTESESEYRNLQVTLFNREQNKISEENYIAYKEDAIPISGNDDLTHKEEVPEDRTILDLEDSDIEERFDFIRDDIQKQTKKSVDQDNGSIANQEKYKDIKAALQKYIKQRRYEFNQSGSSYLNFSIYGRIKGFSAKRKIRAAQELIRFLDHPGDFVDSDLKPKHIAALQDGMLGSIVSRYREKYNNFFPKSLKDKRNLVSELFLTK